MEPSELTHFAAQTLESLGIEDFTTGSMASILYGEPRFTNDVDIVIDLKPIQINRLCAAFPEPDFYVSIEAAREAVARCSQFNVIHSVSGLKIDFMIAARSEYNRERFARAAFMELLSDVSARFASPEDVIIKKLEYYKEGGSEKHLRDIRGILKLCPQPIDNTYIQHWARRRGVFEQWEIARNYDGAG